MIPDPLGPVFMIRGIQQRNEGHGNTCVHVKEAIMKYSS